MYIKKGGHEFVEWTFSKMRGRTWVVADMTVWNTVFTVLSSIINYKDGLFKDIGQGYNLHPLRQLITGTNLNEFIVNRDLILDIINLLYKIEYLKLIWKIDIKKCHYFI